MKKLILSICLLLSFPLFARSYDFIVQYHTPSLLQLANGGHSLSNWWNETPAASGYHSDLELRGTFANVGPVYFLGSASLGHSFSFTEFYSLSFTGGVGANFIFNEEKNHLNGLSLILYPVYDLCFLQGNKTSPIGYKFAFDMGTTYAFKYVTFNFYCRNIMFDINGQFGDMFDFGLAVGFPFSLNFN